MGLGVDIAAFAATCEWDWILIQTGKETKLPPDWEGPFQVLLTTETAVRTAEKGWTYDTLV